MVMVMVMVSDDCTLVDGKVSLTDFLALDRVLLRLVGGASISTSATGAARRRLFIDTTITITIAITFSTMDTFYHGLCCCYQNSVKAWSVKTLLGRLLGPVL